LPRAALSTLPAFIGGLEMLAPVPDIR